LTFSKYDFLKFLSIQPKTSYDDFKIFFLDSYFYFIFEFRGVVKDMLLIHILPSSLDIFYHSPSSSEVLFDIKGRIFNALV